MNKLCIFALTLMLCLGLQAHTASAKTKWVANSVWPPQNHQTIALQEYAKMVKEATNGEVELQVTGGGVLGYKGPELLKVVRDGLVPVSDMLVSGIAGEEKIFQIVTLPFLTQDFKELQLLYEVARPSFDKVAEKWGQKILYISPWPGAGLWSTREVRSLADMKGLKARTYDKNGALVMEATGGTPYALAFSEVYSALATGMIDSVLTSSPTAVDAKFWEVMKYYIPFNVTIATDMVNVNLKAFNKLDKKSQDALIQAGRDLEAKLWQQVQALDDEKVGICVKNGMQKVDPSPEFMKELSAITEHIRAEWLKQASPDAKAIYEEYMKRVER